MTDELLYQSALRVIEDVHTAMFRPTGEIQTMIAGKGADIGKEGTAPPPVRDFLRCVDYYTAVHARHHTNYPVLKQYIHEVLQAAVVIAGTEDGIWTADVLTLEHWEWSNACNADSAERVLQVALRVLERHRTEGG